MKLDFSQEKMHILFEITEQGYVLLKHFSSVPFSEDNKKTEQCFISDIHIAGENPDDRFGAKHTGSSQRRQLKYAKHTYYENEFGNKLEFTLKSPALTVVVHFQFYKGISAVRTWKTIKNTSSEIVGLEYINTFSYSGIDENNLTISIPHNSWSRELEWEKYTPARLGFDRFSSSSTKRIFVSNTGTWSCKEYLPMGVLESDSEAMMWEIENSGSWQWELSDDFDAVYLKLSGPDDQENSWYKELVPGETFECVPACICLGENFESALAQMTSYRRKIFKDNEPNKRLPVIFNDYLLCLWADPTEEKMMPLIDKASELGCEYYCMDAGWYADGAWWDSVGKWEEQKKRFPNGIKKVFDYIKSKGMVPGIWLEIEVMGINCPILDQFGDDCFFMRHGKKAIQRGRYQLDFRNENVRAFATDTVRRVVEEYGAGYIKFDYNIDAGVGTEANSDSFGDGLLEHNRAYLDWVREIKAKYPDLILETCSSGGMRMEYAMLSEHHIQSVTDQANFKDIAYIAAGAPTAVLPEQSAIWACPIPEKSMDEIAFSLISSMLQRIHLSGRIDTIDNDRFMLVKEAIDCYKKIRDDIPGSIPFYPLGIPNRKNGIVCLGFKNKDNTRITVWNVNQSEGEALIPIEFENAEILYPSGSKISISKDSGKLKVTFPAPCTAAVIELN